MKIIFSLRQVTAAPILISIRFHNFIFYKKRNNFARNQSNTFHRSCLAETSKGSISKKAASFRWYSRWSPPLSVAKRGERERCRLYTCGFHRRREHAYSRGCLRHFRSVCFPFFYPQYGIYRFTESGFFFRWWLLTSPITGNDS